MDRLIVEIESFLPKNITRRLKWTHGKEIFYLLTTYSNFKLNRATLGELMFDSKFVMNRTWEKLNIGKWFDVSQHFRQVFAIASLVHVIALLHENKEGAIKNSLEAIDLALLLGYPLEEISLTEVAEVLSSHMPATDLTVQENKTIPQYPNREIGLPLRRNIRLRNEIDTCSKPSLEFFYKTYFMRREPVKLTNCIKHWPALKRWNNLKYIKKKAGHRTVPIEIGKHYADKNHRVKLMKISDFIDEFFSENSTDMGYLAQHQLFVQVPELKKDFTVPDYCALTEKDDQDDPDVDVNAWFGPKGTVSPLHYDAKHNLLCQVAGFKKVTLFPETDSEFLYPLSGMLSNTSGVDVENPDYCAFPNFERATGRECLLKPGQILYIPPRYWHHVRALENSFSVNFWWE